MHPHFSERFARTRGGLADETTWEVAADKQRLLTRWSVALARANAQLLARAATSEPTSPPPSPEREEDDSAEDDGSMSDDSEGADSDETVTGSATAA